MPSNAILIASALYLLKATGILVLTIGAALLLRRASAGIRHSVWLTAVVLVLTLPLFVAALPDWQILPLPASAPPEAALAASEGDPAVTDPADAASWLTAS